MTRISVSPSSCRQPRSRLPLSATSKSLSNLSTPFNLSASPDICSSLHFLRFCLLPTFRPVIVFPPLQVVVFSSRSGASSPEYSYGSGARRVGAKKTLSSPLHTGLRDQTSAPADGWSSSERRASCSSCWPKEKPVQSMSLLLLLLLSLCSYRCDASSPSILHTCSAN